MAKKKPSPLDDSVDGAVDGAMEAIDNFAKPLRDDEYLEYLDRIGSHIEMMLEAKKEEDASSEDE